MASGLPVLAFDYAGAAQLIRHTQTGHLVPFGDATGFVQAAAELAAQPEACRAVGARARCAVQAMGWDGIVSQFEARLQGLRADRSAASHQADHWVSDAAMGR
jgi:glycosyltransferase involved in cell wall biosynthesis